MYFTRAVYLAREGAPLQVPILTSRGFFNLAELPSGVMRAVVLSHRHGKGPYAAVSSVIKAQIRDRRCLSECGHAACTARTNQPPGVDQGSISG